MKKALQFPSLRAAGSVSETVVGSRPREGERGRFCSEFAQIRALQGGSQLTGPRLVLGARLHALQSRPGERRDRRLRKMAGHEAKRRRRVLAESAGKPGEDLPG